MKKISICIPVLNEEENIINTYEAVKNIFKKKLQNYDYEFIFTDNQKVYDLSSLRANTEVVKTNKFKKNLDNFIYKNIKKYKKHIFDKNNNIFLIYAAFARKNSRANTLSLLNKKDFY